MIFMGVDYWNPRTNEYQGKTFTRKRHEACFKCSHKIQGIFPLNSTPPPPLDENEWWGVSANGGGGGGECVVGYDENEMWGW